MGLEDQIRTVFLSFLILSLIFRAPSKLYSGILMINTSYKGKTLIEPTKQIVFFLGVNYLLEFLMVVFMIVGGGSRFTVTNNIPYLIGLGGSAIFTFLSSLWDWKINIHIFGSIKSRIKELFVGNNGDNIMGGFFFVFLTYTYMSTTSYAIITIITGVVFIAIIISIYSMLSWLFDNHPGGTTQDEEDN